MKRLIFLFAILLIPSTVFLRMDVAEGARFVDPRRSLSGYARWCKSIGGSVYNANTTNIGCTPGKSTGRMSYGGRTFGGSNPYQMMFGIMGNILQQQMRCAMDPNCNGSARRRRKLRSRLAEQRRKRAVEARAQREHIRKEMEWARNKWKKDQGERRRKLAQAKKNILGKMKTGVQSDPFKIRTGTGLVTLKPKLVDAPEVPGSPLEKQECTAYLLRRAEDNAGTGDFGEAAYLSEQAGKMIQDGDIEVTCPRMKLASNKKDIGKVIYNRKMTSYLRQHSKLYEKLYKRADQEQREWAKKSDAVDAAIEKVNLSKTNRDAVQKELSVLEAQNARQPGSVPLGALARARGKLMEMNKILRDEGKNLIDTRQALVKVGKRMQATSKIFDEASRGPKAWGPLLQRMGT